MLKAIVARGSALGLLVVGVIVGAAGAEVVNGLQRTLHVTSGLFTVEQGESIDFHVALDGRSAGPVRTVLLRLVDELGTSKSSKVVTLGPGQAATLTHAAAGRFRALAEVYESAVDVGDRRFVATTVEVSEPNAAKPHRRLVCSAGEGLETGRQ
jgi:hypothetical protein